MANILIVGCGDVGSRLALLLANDGHNVFGVRRSAHSLPNVTMLQADISQPFSLPISDLDYAYIILSPDGSNQAAYEKTFIDGVNHIRAALEPYSLKRVFFVSSILNETRAVSGAFSTLPIPETVIVVLVWSERACLYVYTDSIIRNTPNNTATAIPTLNAFVLYSSFIYLLVYYFLFPRLTTYCLVHYIAHQIMLAENLQNREWF